MSRLLCILCLLFASDAFSKIEVSGDIKNEILEMARSQLLPEAQDFPEGYREVYCDTPEKIYNPDSRILHFYVECHISTSCGPVGTAFIYSVEKWDSQIQEIMKTSWGGYMGEDFRVKVDLNGDNIEEIVFVPGTDQVVEGEVKVFAVTSGEWENVSKYSNCGEACKALGIAFHDSGNSKELIAIKKCDNDYNDSEDCRGKLSKLILENGYIEVVDIWVDDLENPKNFLDALSLQTLQNKDQYGEYRTKAVMEVLTQIYSRYDIELFDVNVVWQ